jgi:diguanylate cyclase (GGDEF)-like protein
VGGFAQSMELRSFVAMPLMSATGPVGMVMCGDKSGTRHWTHQDRALARQIAIEGALIVDSARLRQAEAQHVAELTRQAYHDALTGLPNRSQLMLKAGQALAAGSRDGRRTALLLLDLDGFKGVNDTAGHHAGDALLQAVGGRLLDSVRDDDLVSRLGGDEFAVLLTRDPDEAAAAATAGRIHRRLLEPYLIEGLSLSIGASVGIALFPDDAGDVAALMRGADAAMYRAKRNGGGIRRAG